MFENPEKLKWDFSLNQLSICTQIKAQVGRRCYLDRMSVFQML